MSQTLTPEEVQELRAHLPAIQKVVAILEAENVVVDSGITVDDRTSFLGLPLPHPGNRLEVDIARLRDAYGKLDTTSEGQHAALAEEARRAGEAETALRLGIAGEIQRAGEVEAALAKRLNGVEGKSARINAKAFSFVVFDDPEAEGSAYTAQQAEMTEYALVQLGLESVEQIPELIGVHNVNGDHLFLFNPAVTDISLEPQWVDNGLDTVSVAASETFGVLKTATAEDVAEGAAVDAAVTPNSLKEGHDASPSAHDALVRRITVGDVSPVIGVCQVVTGNTTGLYFNVDAEGQPITPNRRYFDYHPVYDSMRRVLVDDQVMVRVDPFWFKFFKPDSGPFAGKPCRVIAPGQADGFKPFPAFLDTAGNVVPLYIGAFSSTDEGGGKAGSRPGKMPLVSLDFPTMRTRCLNRNAGGVSGFRMWDIYHYSALVHLFLTEHCSPEAQGLYGRGWVDSSSAVIVDDDHQPNWRGFTGLWGNVWEMCDGFRLDTSRRIEMFKNDGSQTYVGTDKVFPAYDGSNPAYAITVQEGEGAAWDMGDGYFPLTSSTSRAAGSFGDYMYGGYGSAGNVLYVGGTWNDCSGAGLFCWGLSSPAGYSAAHIGCRLAKT